MKNNSIHGRGLSFTANINPACNRRGGSLPVIRRTSRLWLWASIFWLLIDFSRAELAAQTIVYATPGQYLRGQALQAVTQFAGAIGDLERRNQQLEKEIAEARAQFWESHEATREAVAEQYENALAKKDLHNLAASQMQYSFGGSAYIYNSLMKLAREASGNDRVDGGISPYCHTTFKAWAEAVATDVAAKRNPEVADLQRAVENRMPLYNKYRVERDIAEFLFLNPRGTLRAAATNPLDYLACWMLATKLETTIDAANAAATQISKTVGNDRLVEIVDHLRSWSVVKDSIEGPFARISKRYFDDLIAGKEIFLGREPWSEHQEVFLKLRETPGVRGINKTQSLETIQGLWMSSRKTKDWALLQQAIAEKNKLVEQMEKTVLADLTLLNSDNKLTLSMVGLNLNFLEYYLDALERDLAYNAKPNPRPEYAMKVTQEYLSTRGKLGTRKLKSSASGEATGSRGASEVSTSESGTAGRTRTPLNRRSRGRAGGETLDPN